MEHIEAQLRQILASTVWTHKIQEKQADIYLNKYNLFETIRIIVLAITTSGIVSCIFVDEVWIKIVTAILSAISLFISTYLKSYDLKGLHQSHKETAIQLLELREDIISVICDIRTNIIGMEDLIKKRDEIKYKYLSICKNSLDAKNSAVKKASKALKVRQDNTYSNEEINSYLPVALRKNK